MWVLKLFILKVRFFLYVSHLSVLISNGCGFLCGQKHFFYPFKNWNVSYLQALQGWACAFKLHEAEVKPSHGQNDGSVEKVPLSFWVFVLIWHQTEGVGSGQVVRWNFNPSLHQGTCCFSGNWAWRWWGSIVCLQNDSLTFPVSSQVEGDVRDWSLMSLWGAIARLSWQDWFKWGWANALRILGT